MTKKKASAQPSQSGKKGGQEPKSLRGVDCGALASSLNRHYDAVTRANSAKPHPPSGMIVHGDVGDFGDFEKRR